MSKKKNQGYSPNNYRARKLKKGYLITTDHGSWAYLNARDRENLNSGNIKNKKLFDLLEDKGIIQTKKNKNIIIQRFRKKHAFLFQGTSLHIIVPTLRCNMKCSYCHASSEPLNAKGCDMDRDIVRRVVDFIFQSPSQAITIEFQGGEPLINFEVVKSIIEYANKLNEKRKKRLLMTIVTNLSLLDDKKLDYLLKNNVSICTSLDGPRLVHDYNRRFISGNGTYASVTKNIALVRRAYKKEKSNKKLNALITITKKSLNYPKEIVDAYLKNGLDNIHLRFLNNLGYAKTRWKNVGYTAEEFIKFWKKAMDYIIELNKKGTFIKERTAWIMLKKILTEYDPGYLDLRSPCGAAIGQLLYNYDGKIYTCDEGRMIGGGVFEIGDVNKDFYKKVLTSNQAYSIIYASVNDAYVCNTCAYKPYCGVCPVCNYAEQGNIIGKLPETNRCKIFKAQFDYIFNKLIFDKTTKKILLNWIK